MRSSVSLVLMGTQPIAMLCIVETCLRPSPDVRSASSGAEAGFLRAVVTRFLRRRAAPE